MKKAALLTVLFLPHLSAALAFNLGTFFVIDRFNRAMAFLDNGISKWMTALLCLLVAALCLFCFALRSAQRKKERAAKDVFRFLLTVSCALLATLLFSWFVCDLFDHSSGFLSSNLSKWLLFAFAVLSLTLSVWTIVRLRKGAGGRPKKSEKRQRSQK